MARREDSFSVSMLGFLLGMGLIVLRGLCLSIVWGWFVVPLGVPAIGKAHALGLGCLIGLFWQKPKNKNDETDSWKLMLQAVVELGLAMLIAWICHYFMVSR